ncbi:hypothetical protein NLJ89_g11273 [Agrocybe chaxingu]|uniref:Uncharacterized protein n=1 Tax=Agrocybe chaxingu TaxID=84603 RepID=A0A9W8JM75_9AGAR|nr:hypothetical protein NLJ89_g11273 [Agrocybe chaxingu]
MFRRRRPSVQLPTNVTPVRTLAGASPRVVEATAPTPGSQAAGGSQLTDNTSAVAPKVVDPTLPVSSTSSQHARKEPPLPPKGQKRKRATTIVVDINTNASTNPPPAKRNRNTTGSSRPTAPRTRPAPRTQPAPNPSKPTATTSSAREWFEKAKGQFSSEDLGEAWKRLVVEWEAFQEEEDAFADGRVLPARCRPESIGMWIGRARLPTWRPSNPNAKEDEEHFKMWWMALQPAWRVVDGKVVTKSMKGNWSALRLPGINGVQSIIAALFFWGISASTKVRTRKAWTAAVEECIRFFEQLRLQASSST